MMLIILYTMYIRQTVIRQYQGIVDAAATHARNFTRPPEGWVRTVRKGLGMSGAQLARRLGVTRAFVSQTEKNELTGSVTVKTLQQMAEAMGCRFVYAIVPEGATAELVVARAREKARSLVEQAGRHMALEAQALSDEQMHYEIEQLQRQILADLPADLWNND